MSIEVCEGSRGTVFVWWLVGQIPLLLGLIFRQFKVILTTLRKCAGEQAISVVVVIKTMAAVVFVFRLRSSRYLDHGGPS